jgi:hypothetical protein
MALNDANAETFKDLVAALEQEQANANSNGPIKTAVGRKAEG